MEFKLLGPLELWHGGQRLDPGPRKRRAILAVLLLELNTTVPVERLVDLVWGEAPPPAVRSTVFGHVSRIRSALRGHAAAQIPVEVVTTDTGYLVRADPDLVDLHRFRRLVAGGAGEDPGARSARLRSALALWRGPALSDIPDDAVRERLAAGIESQRLGALEEAVEADLALGRHHELVGELTELVARHPTREALLRALMRALYRDGQQAEALEAGRRARSRLAEEYGLEIGAAVGELELAILRRDPSLDPAGSPAGRPAPRELPQRPPDFVGREAELAELASMVEADAGRVPVAVNLTGMAGVGKTALAVQAAHHLAPRYPDGQIFVDLRGFTEGVEPVESDAALGQILMLLGTAPADLPPSLDMRAALYRDLIAGRRLLIVLDNAASEGQVRPLLPAAPGCLALLTSRIVFGGLDEVRSLALDVLSREAATSLLAGIAGGARDAAAVEVADLCGGLPLALRLAASRLRHRRPWTMAHLAARLREQQGRLHELHAGERSVATAFDLSYRGLTGAQRHMFLMLSLTPGADIDVAAAGAVAAVSGPGALRALDDLVDVHLLEEPSPGRYQFHDLVRSYARSRSAEALDPADRDAAADRLYAHYLCGVAALRAAYAPGTRQRALDAATAGSPFPPFADRAAALAWWAAERHNLLAVTYAAGDTGRHPLMRLLAEAMFLFLEQNAHLGDGLSLFAYVADRLNAAGDTAGEVVAVRSCAVFADHLGRTGEALGYARRAYEVVARDGVPVLRASVLIDLGGMLANAGDLVAAEARLTEALALIRAVEDPVHRAGGEEYCLRVLSPVQWVMGDADGALRSARRAAALSVDIDNPAGTGEAHLLIGRYLRLLGRYPQAREHLDRAARAWAVEPDAINENLHLVEVGALRAALGHHGEALATLHTALARARDTRDSVAAFGATLELGVAHRAAGDLPAALDRHRAALDAATELGQPAAIVRARNELARTLHAMAEPERAAELWDRVLRDYADTGIAEVRDAREALARGRLAARQPVVR